MAGAYGAEVQLQPDALQHKMSMLQAISESSPLGEQTITFTLALQKNRGENLGIDVTYCTAESWAKSGVFVATLVEGGLVAAWNMNCKDSQKVRPGDFIFQVNSVYGDTVAIIQEMMRKSELTLHMLRRTHAGGTVPSPMPSAGATEESQSQPNPEVITTSLSGAIASPPGVVVSPPPPPGAPPPPPPPQLQLQQPPPEEPSSVGGSELNSSPVPNGGSQQQQQQRSGESAGEAEPQEVQSVASEILALEDEALASLIGTVLERRPWLQQQVLRPGEEA
eukprot:TRINITY_DN5431_c0_g1_i1.p1 TRINITY_DN5431_c0_g1~~TRINITY_DN5431_c0_g1_i1.p1  ORF type:complete len:291 (+),score=78.17 TRINITY_DN5431_c0_g1_i1:39-875(+)